jgi:hypothetical protein
MPAAPSRKTLRLVAGVALAWWISLGLMAALTSNPAVLNVSQILDARLVIEARSTAAADSVEVVRVYAADRLEPPAEIISVSNLAQVIDILESNESCLMPLSPDGDGGWVVGGWQFRDKGNRKSIPVIYPATSTTRARLKQILEQAKRKILDRPIPLDHHFVQATAP